MDNDERIADHDAEEVEEVEGSDVDEIAEDNAEGVELDPDSYTVEISPLFAASAVIFAGLLTIASSLVFSGSLGHLGLLIVVLVTITGFLCMPIAVWTHRKLDHFPPQGTVYAFLLSMIISGAVVFGFGSLFMLMVAMTILFKKRLIDRLPTWRIM